MSDMGNRTCQTCNRTFSKAEHLTRHLRSHTNERPHECSVCGKLYSRSDVLRRHERNHHKASRQSRERSVGENELAVLTPLSRGTPRSADVIANCHTRMSGLSPTSLEADRCKVRNNQPAHGVNLYDSLLHADASGWFPGAPLDVEALDITLSSAVSEWAQFPSIQSMSGLADIGSLHTPTATSTRAIPTETDGLPANNVKQRWFTLLTVQEEMGPPQTTFSNHSGGFGQGNVAADENYRVGLSQKLQPRMHDETLPSAEQLNLFANLFFTRFHSLLPVVHVPSFKPTTENSLLFVSICSVGSLFAGSPYAVAQGMRLFDRLNKAILASWESMLSHSCSDALSMVQAAVIGQTFAILSGRPKDLVLADVLHGTVAAWARESDKKALPAPSDPKDMAFDGADIEEQWSRWIDHEQRRRVEVTLNIHDAELANLLHHEPIRKHRLTQYPRLASDALFMAPTASKWAELYKKPMSTLRIPRMDPDDPLQAGGADSKFAAYGVLESINAHVIEARRSNTFDEHESRRLSNMLMWWWRRYSFHFLSQEDDDPFGLPVLWHSVYIVIYADIDLLEQASGRDGQSAVTANSPLVRSWSNSLDASKCLVHAFLIQRYLERMRVSSEPAIHVPRGLFYAALSWFCFTRIGGRQEIDAKAFDAPEIQLLGIHTTPPGTLKKAIQDSVSADTNHVHRLIDLLNRVGRWGISYAFASVLCAVVAESNQGAINF
ncbi:hypothetical protein BDV26DRAFT_289347 [Aspergillus bertholletiae]|uniref:C2H2-type domain-containing protein n=1 Tax=Aspergillus bertholletiae TaxID=1226010 RepID=A0A5N7BID1_9EURO|nr:hypothetical protein BDV26DRAFT_289347 [Aspergillus bertholletiae]